MKRIHLSSGLVVGFITAVGFMENGCASAHLVTASSAPVQEHELFEDVMVTGSHILYRVPTDKTITPIHIPPKVSPLTPSSIDVVDSDGLR